jgi:hypothetical protein
MKIFFPLKLSLASFSLKKLSQIELTLNFPQSKLQTSKMKKISIEKHMVIK